MYKVAPSNIDPGVGKILGAVTSPLDMLKNKICSGMCCNITIFNPTYPDCCGMLPGWGGAVSRNRHYHSRAYPQAADLRERAFVA